MLVSCVFYFFSPFRVSHGYVGQVTGLALSSFPARDARSASSTKTKTQASTSAVDQNSRCMNKKRILYDLPADL